MAGETDAKAVNWRSADIHHVGLTTPDIEGSVAFWTSVMGFEALPIRGSGAPWVASFTGVAGGALRTCLLSGFGIRIEFVEFLAGQDDGEPVRPTMTSAGHVCFAVDRVEPFAAAIAAAGGAYEGRVTTITDGIQPGRQGVYMRDPFGLLIELLERAPTQPV
jgi:catechol 2,3-dioxygenase-like lactoylglutathione lyase family enzyme